MEFLLNDFLGTPTWMWAVFISLVLGLLALDLGVLHKNSKEIGIRESLLMSGFYRHRLGLRRMDLVPVR
ncbi:hypothetical protein P3T33_000483 [Rhizobium sp. AN67]|nr:hypothetical protein [Rhizobium sp. AN67]